MLRRPRLSDRSFLKCDPWLGINRLLSAHPRSLTREYLSSLRGGFLKTGLAPGNIDRMLLRTMASIYTDPRHSRMEHWPGLLRKMHRLTAQHLKVSPMAGGTLRYNSTSFWSTETNQNVRSNKCLLRDSDTDGSKVWKNFVNSNMKASEAVPARVTVFDVAPNTLLLDELCVQTEKQIPPSTHELRPSFTADLSRTRHYKLSYDPSRDWRCKWESEWDYAQGDYDCDQYHILLREDGSRRYAILAARTTLVERLTHPIHRVKGVKPLYKTVTRTGSDRSGDTVPFCLNSRGCYLEATKRWKPIQTMNSDELLSAASAISGATNSEHDVNFWVEIASRFEYIQASLSAEQVTALLSILLRRISIHLQNALLNRLHETLLLNIPGMMPGDIARLAYWYSQYPENNTNALQMLALAIYDRILHGCEEIDSLLVIFASYARMAENYPGVALPVVQFSADPLIRTAGRMGPQQLYVAAVECFNLRTNAPPELHSTILQQLQMPSSKNDAMLLQHSLLVELGFVRCAPGRHHSCSGSLLSQLSLDQLLKLAGSASAPPRPALGESTTDSSCTEEKRGVEDNNFDLNLWLNLKALLPLRSFTVSYERLVGEMSWVSQACQFRGQKLVQSSRAEIYLNPSSSPGSSGASTIIPVNVKIQEHKVPDRTNDIGLAVERCQQEQDDVATLLRVTQWVQRYLIAPKLSPPKNEGAASTLGDGSDSSDGKISITRNETDYTRKCGNNSIDSTQEFSFSVYLLEKALQKLHHLSSTPADLLVHISTTLALCCRLVRLAPRETDRQASLAAIFLVSSASHLALHTLSRGMVVDGETLEELLFAACTAGRIGNDGADRADELRRIRDLFVKGYNALGGRVDKTRDACLPGVCLSAICEGVREMIREPSLRASALGLLTAICFHIKDADVHQYSLSQIHRLLQAIGETHEAVSEGNSQAELETAAALNGHIRSALGDNCCKNIETICATGSDIDTDALYTLWKQYLRLYFLQRHFTDGNMMTGGSSWSQSESISKGDKAALQSLAHCVRSYKRCYTPEQQEDFMQDVRRLNIIMV